MAIGVEKIMAEIIVLQTGYTLISPATPNASAVPFSFAYTGLFQKRKNRIKVPVKAFLVIVNGKKILVDTGWSRECAKHPIKHLGFGMYFASEPVMTENEAVINRFEKMNIKPSDLDAVIFTHLDGDHTSGIVDLIGAKHYYTTRNEVEYADRNKIRYKNFWKNINLEVMNMVDDRSAPFGKSCDLFGDSSVVVYLTKGHSAGSVAVKINDNGKFAVLAGDNGYCRASWEQLVLPGIIYDKNAMKKSLTFINELSKKKECVTVLAAHDPEITQTHFKY